MLRAGVVLAVAYGVTWGVTATWGVHRIRAAEIARYEAELRRTGDDSKIVARPDVESGYTTDSARSVDGLEAWGWVYTIRATSPAPLVVRLETGAQSGPLMGSGQTEWWVWVPGFSWLVRATGRWVS